MNSNPPSHPDFFLKPTTSLLLHRNEKPYATIEIPKMSGGEIHHEVELGVVIGSITKNVSEEEAFNHVAGFFLGLDMTDRNLQTKASKAGTPWTSAKAFDTSCPVGDEFIPLKTLYDTRTKTMKQVNLFLKVNNEMRQYSSTGNMVFPIEKQIAAISQVMTLEEGDLILTGTPEGDGSVHAGDVIEAGIEGVTKIYRFEVKNA
jgi:acylpyruvate hydrolase